MKYLHYISQLLITSAVFTFFLLLFGFGLHYLDVLLELFWELPVLLKGILTFVGMTGLAWWFLGWKRKKEVEELIEKNGTNKTK